ncbi:MAG: NUDIX hydrolase [Anaerolineae bacterium]|nr:NUDIX hydrolase [Anaerolineae bacterium]MDW8072049.1 NUDIX hydrolase [Anaerolineae bacterium]
MSELPEKVIKSQPIYDGRIVRFRVDTIELPDGRTTIREIVNTPGAVTILPLTEDRRVRMVRQYRSAVGEYLLELPAGTLRPGEPPEEAAVRELAEETGDRAARWRYLTSFYTMPGVCNEIIHLFLATELVSGSTNHDLDESIEVVTLPIEQAWEMIRTGQIRDAKTIVGLLMARILECDAP